MAAGKRKPPRQKAKGKTIRGRLPSKRSINLVLIDEKKVSVPKVLLGMLLIVLLAGVFSKYFVIDRLSAMYAAQERVDNIKIELAQAKEKLNTFGDLEETYAHYTFADMTVAETGLVDRVSVLELVGTMLPGGETALSPQEFEARLVALLIEFFSGVENPDEEEPLYTRFLALLKRVIPTGYSIKSWSAAGNLLTVDINGTTLERLNRVARKLEKEAMVDTCAITTAKKIESKNIWHKVQARFIIYMRQVSAEEVSAK